MSAKWMPGIAARITPGKLPDPVESNILAALLALIERVVAARLLCLDDLLKTGVNGQSMMVEEYLNVDELARRLHTEPKTIRDRVHKKRYRSRRCRLAAAGFRGLRLKRGLRARGRDIVASHCTDVTQGRG
jgi:hypothetical protein